MEFAQARGRPRAEEDVPAEAPSALRLVPDDLTPAERRDWQQLAERRDRRERAERADASRRRRSSRPADGPSRRRGEQGELKGAQVGPAMGEAPATVAPDRRRARPEAHPRPRAASVPGAAPLTHRVEPQRHEGFAPRPRPAPARPRVRLPRLSGVAAGPDRLALWAVVLCLFMALVAAATARGAEPAEPARDASAAAPRVEAAPPFAASPVR